MKVILGAGRERIEGWKTLDVSSDVNPDFVHDLHVLPLPFDDNSVSEFIANQVLEHIGRCMFIPLINDIYRCLTPNGLLRIEAPYGVTPARLCDPTHYSHVFFTEFLGRYFNRAELPKIGLFVGYGGIMCNFEEVLCERFGHQLEGIRYIWRALK